MAVSSERHVRHERHEEGFAMNRWCVVLSLVLTAMAGCGGGRPAVYPVTGQVVFADGAPVKLGTVELLSVEHKLNANGTIRDDGTFVLGTFASDDGACAGEHQAIVTQLIVIDPGVKHERDHGAAVDPVFASYASSGLRVTIKPDGPNNITLTVGKAKSP